MIDLLLGPIRKVQDYTHRYKTAAANLNTLSEPLFVQVNRHTIKHPTLLLQEKTRWKTGTGGGHWGPKTKSKNGNG